VTAEADQAPAGSSPEPGNELLSVSALQKRVDDAGHLDRCWLSVDDKRRLRETTIVGEAEEVA